MGSSIAKSLGALTVSREVFERCRAVGPTRMQPFVTSDAAAVAACIQLATEHRVLVEPACGTAVAAVTERCESLRDCSTIVVQVCGGAIVTPSMLNAWARDLGVQGV